MTAVLDASAAIALLRTEPGHDRVADRLRGSLISAVNYTEVVQKLAQLGSDSAAEDAAVLSALGMTVAAFDAEAAVRTAEMWPVTRHADLSLGDRACLALAASLPDGIALTTDRAWAGVDVGVPVELIR
ncbi:type II toxin-antitoxin system VapC family toxin [Amycolatopsis palatopharyngis]|uniref:type II toxin-antitoxin system VapC family toxin n=1 Tax=Amycolatopsis palatopharyngis TaxID=187982 RepID=UPI001B87534E|nr:type II toxin-antitoxin system VapC family toxin [Amycolatopsis palatopharyngis]